VVCVGGGVGAGRRSVRSHSYIASHVGDLESLHVLAAPIAAAKSSRRAQKQKCQIMILDVAE
jgi:uncharacterized membrane protein